MLKPHTSSINLFLQVHCEINNIVTTEQAGGKKDVRDCLEQLMINKIITRGGNKTQKISPWLNCQKAFNSIPHE